MATKRRGTCLIWRRSSKAICCARHSILSDLLQLWDEHLLNSTSCAGKVFPTGVTTKAPGREVSTAPPAHFLTSSIRSFARSAYGTVMPLPAHADAPVPLIKQDTAVDWWFVFKLNTKHFPGCAANEELQSCRFGGEVQPYSGGEQYCHFQKTTARKLRSGLY